MFCIIYKKCFILVIAYYMESSEKKCRSEFITSSDLYLELLDTFFTLCLWMVMVETVLNLASLIETFILR